MLVRIRDEAIPQLGSFNLYRSPGLHLSQVIRDLEITQGTARYAEGWVMENAAAVGLIWEDLLSLAFAASIGPRLGEIERDGIICTPDGFDGHSWAVEENKATWRHYRTKPWMVWSWMTQVQGYCWVTGSSLCRMRVLYVNGDYESSGPLYLCCELEFEEYELRRNWEMITEHAEIMRCRI